VALLLGIASAGCAVQADEQLGTAQAALTCPPPAIDNRSVVENDPVALRRFPLARTLRQLITLSGTPTSVSGLWTQWRNTFVQSCPGPQPCRPQVQAALAMFDPVTSTAQFEPVALFNRFDLAPSNGANCGEYRIVYAADQSAGVGRGFIIFEGRLANPSPFLGIRGCIPVMDFWAELSTIPDAATRGKHLEEFFYDGLPGFDPVVHPANYGVPQAGIRRGQIRTDYFFDGEWNLREFQLRQSNFCTIGGCPLLVEQVTVKENPSNALFSGTDPASLAFQASFIGEIPKLSAGRPSEIAMATPDQFNTLESNSQNSDMDYDLFASPAFRAQVEAASPTFTASELFLRATTQTCAGCHQLSSNDCLGPGACDLSRTAIRWPDKSERFVHVNEAGTLSEALLVEFLPFRLKLLAWFLETACMVQPFPSADPNTTVSGKPLDSPN